MIANLDDAVVRQVRQIAWQQGVPLEEMMRRLLIHAMRDQHVQSAEAESWDDLLPAPTD
jgi:hypothetical protein